MGRVREFFNNLQKSTKVTLISCGCFILLTFLILIFFVMFPITRAERANASVGRESVQKNDSAVTTMTDVNGSVIVSMGTTKNIDADVTTTYHTDYVIIVTTGKGFYSDGRIPTGNFSYDEYSTTANETNEYTMSPDEGIGYQPGDVPDEYVEPVVTTAEYVEPVVTEPYTEPIVTTAAEPVVTEAPVVTEQPVTEAPTEAPADSGGENAEPNQ